MADDPVDQDLKPAIREAVERYPGIHFRALVRELGTSTSLLRYHLEDLLEAEEVRSHEVGGYTRYFPPGADRELDDGERAMLEVLRQDRPLEITLAILDLGSPVRHKDLVEVTGLAKGTVTYHLDKLRDAGVVRRIPRGDDRGFHLEDPDAVRDLLADFEPVPDVLDRVSSTWEDLFGGHREG